MGVFERRGVPYQRQCTLSCCHREERGDAGDPSSALHVLPQSACLLGNELICHCEGGLPTAAIHEDFPDGWPRRFAPRHDKLGTFLSASPSGSAFIRALAMTD